MSALCYSRVILFGAPLSLLFSALPMLFACYSPLLLPCHSRPAIVLQQSAIVCGLSSCSLWSALSPPPRDSLLLPACHHVLFYFILFYLILPAVVTGRVFLFPHRVLPLHSVLFSSSLMRGIVPSSFRIAVFPVPSLYLQSMPCSLCYSLCFPCCSPCCSPFAVCSVCCSLCCSPCCCRLLVQ